MIRESYVLFLFTPPLFLKVVSRGYSSIHPLTLGLGYA